MVWLVISLVVICFIFGLGEGVFLVVSVKGVVENFSCEEWFKMFLLLMFFNYIGSMLVLLLIVLLIMYFGWCVVFYIIGIVGLVFVFVYWFCVCLVWFGKDGFKVINKEVFVVLLKMLLMWKIVVVWFGLFIINKGFDSWMLIYLMIVCGFNFKVVGLLLLLFYIMVGLLIVIGGWVMVCFFDGCEKLLLIVFLLLIVVFVYCMYIVVIVEGVIVW